jgi:putative peptidoglycan lipid II flippase
LISLKRWLRKRPVVRRTIVQLFGGNLFSKMLGLAREVLAAGLFGTGGAIGAYRVAQTGTLVPVFFFTSDSLNSAFVPQYKLLLAHSRDQAQTLFYSLAGLFGVLAVVLAVGVWFMAKVWVGMLAPGLTEGTNALAIEMLRIMGIGVPFYLLSALLMFLAMANGDFVPMAVRPSVQNIGLIAGVVSAYLLKSATLLAWGFTIAYASFAVWGLARAVHSGFLAFPRRWLWSNVRVVLTAFWHTLRPLVFLPVLLQGNIAVERAVASLIGLAVVSGVDYAKFVTETLIVLVSMPVAFAGLGHWSGLAAEEMNRRLGRVTLLVLLLAVPASAFLLAHAHVVVQVLYARGAFDAASVRVTGDILFGIAVGLWAQVPGYVLIKALNAQMRNKAVLRVMAVALVANAAFNFLAYQKLGAMTLGLGNSLYGIILLVGALIALGLVRDVFARGWVIAVAAAGYLLLNRYLPEPSSAWWNLGLAVGVALVYWGLWVALVPALRQAVLEAVGPMRRNAA